MLNGIERIIIPIAIFLGTYLVGSILRRILFKRLQAFSKRTKTELDDIIFSAIRSPFMMWFLILGVYLGMESADLPRHRIDSIGKILLAIGIFSVTLVLANISSRLIRLYGSKIETLLPVTSLTEHISKIIIMIVGILVILNSLGISVVPILATLGVGGLAVALALQDTLSNLFAGFHIIMARQVRIGDFVKLETGDEGYVIDINWRTTKIRMLPNNVVLVPNSKLAQAIVINYYLPDTELAVVVQVGVHYQSDLKDVERVTCEVGKEVMKEVAGGVAGFDPFIRYHTFADFSINFTVNLRGKEFADQYLIKHEFIKRLHERYAKEKINIPYPVQAVNYTQEKAADAVN